MESVLIFLSLCNVVARGLAPHDFVCSLDQVGPGDKQLVDVRRQRRAELGLGDEPVGAHRLGRGAILGVIVQGEDDDARRLWQRLDLPRRLQAVHAGHRQVHQHQVRAQPSGLFQRLVARKRAPGDLDVGLLRQEARG